MKTSKPKCKDVFAQFLRNESGATAMEYVLLTAILGVGLILGVGGIAFIINSVWGGVDGNVSGS